MTNSEKIESYLDNPLHSLTVVECMEKGWGTEMRSEVSKINKFYEFMKSPYRIIGTRIAGSRCKRYWMYRGK